jgi:hypothetical protein
MRQVLLVAAAVIAAVVLTQLLFEFYQWNKLQECAAAGGRNCGGLPQRIER